MGNRHRDLRIPVQDRLVAAASGNRRQSASLLRRAVKVRRRLGAHWQLLSRHVRQDGLAVTARLVFDRLAGHLFDLRYGTDTEGQVDVADIETDSSNLGHSEGYMPTRLSEFRTLMMRLDPPTGAFVDFGSGKGRVLLLASRYDFQRVVGVEFSRRFCDIARANIMAFKAKRPRSAPIEVIEADAASYRFVGDEAVLFLYNPFKQPVLEGVLTNLRNSLAERPRKIVAIYNNPVYAGTIEASGSLRLASVHRISASTFNVYSNFNCR